METEHKNGIIYKFGKDGCKTFTFIFLHHRREEGAENIKSYSMRRKKHIT